jgi:trehalose 6-phosphate phosphatase
MPHPRNDPPPLPKHVALFLDFDGTLAPLAQRPDEVRVPDWVIPSLTRLQVALRGAIAIVSGRSIASLDALLDPLILPAAGAHGAERRDAQGKIESRARPLPAAIRTCAAALAARHEGLLLELKPGGLALHFRLRHELEPVCRAELSRALEGLVGPERVWTLQQGHEVWEVRQHAISKGSAVEAFLAEGEFGGRTPVFVGDDASDEDGFRAVQAAGGFGVRVGCGHTVARYRLADPQDVAAWLGAAAGGVSKQTCERGAT